MRYKLNLIVVSTFLHGLSVESVRSFQHFPTQLKFRTLPICIGNGINASTFRDLWARVKF